MAILSEHYIEKTTATGKREIPVYNTDLFGHIPTTIFKYFDLSKTYNIQSIIDNYVWFSDPTTFNDPYDCTTPFAYDILSEDQVYCQQYYRDFSYERFPLISEKDRELFIALNVKEMQSKKGNKKYFENLYYEAGYELQMAALKEFGILSTCMINDNILLWSHYAANHTGVCLGINTNFLLESLDSPGIGEVNYKDFPLIPPPFVHDKSNLNSSFAPIFLNKAPFWNYELEYRVFLYPIQERKRFLNNALEAIYLGNNISPENRDFMINNICRPSSGRVKLYQAKKVYLKYELEFNEVNY